MNDSNESNKGFTKARHCNADAFVDEFGKHSREMDNKRFCFVLGAGASKSSGISLGGELAIEWLKELHQQEGASGQSLGEWATSANLGIPGFTLARAADHYTRIFERRFEGRMDDGQFWIEQKFGAALPSTGYYFLAQILGGSKHKVVITTNFDNLVSDAVLQLTGNLPRIISDARIARFLSPQPRLPIIAKVHGDIGFATTVNTTEGVAELDKEWKEPLRRILELYVPIVIGWEGNDGSLMDFFTKVMVDDRGQSMLPAGIFWCYRGEKSWQDRLSQNPKLAALSRVHTVRFIEIAGFDDWMFRLARSLIKENPLEKLQSQQKRRMDVFEGKLRNELKQGEKAAAAHHNLASRENSERVALSVMIAIHDAMQRPSDVERTKRLREIVETYPDSADALAALAVELHKSKGSAKEVDDLYIKAIAASPGNADILCNYAIFLHKVQKDNEKADQYFRAAISADPRNAVALGNYGAFLKSVKKDFGRAEEMFQRAMAVEPGNSYVLGNYANVLTELKDRDRAEEYYRRALIIDPLNASIIGNYSSFLLTERKDSERCEELLQKALAIDPNHDVNLGNYANFLFSERRDFTRAEEYFQKSLAVNPDQPIVNGNYASFLFNVRKDMNRAEEFFKKAIAMGPDQPSILGNYASFLSRFNDRLDQSEGYFQKALVLDPNNAAVLGNYAVFLQNKLKQNDKAEEYFQKALGADSEHPINLANYASFLHTERRNIDRAEKYYVKAHAADPNNATTLGNYANFLYRERNDSTKAEECYLKALEIDPKDAAILSNYARFLQAQGKGKRSEEFHLKAMEIDPNDADILSSYASFLNNVGKDRDRAEEHWKKALAVDPTHLMTLSNYALFLMEERKDINQAEEYYLKALSISPNELNVLANFSELLLIYRPLKDAIALLARTARCEALRNPSESCTAAAVLWMSAVAASKAGRPSETMLGGIKALISIPNYAASFSYSELIGWVQKNLQPLDEVAFWVAVAGVCGGTAKLESLAEFPRWHDSAPVPLEESLTAVENL